MQKKFVIRRILLIAFTNLLLAPPASGQTVSYSPGDSFALDPTIGNTNQDFGVVHVESESPSGWTLQIRSHHHSAMNHMSGKATIRYSLEVDGNIVNLSSGNDVTAFSTSHLTCTSPSGCNYAIRGRISANEIDGKPSGAYSDTLIFTLIDH